MRAKLQLLAWALVLLALADPALVPLVLDVVGIGLVMAAAVVAGIIGWALANASLTLTAASVLLLLHAFPGVLRWLCRSWVASVAAVAPEKA
ncbi:hypothetical protein [Streptomyces glaucus]|uniref:Secreted protein n=1 Tax=Streptomyces glaucus TaxID=284029 RepID=A0ABP5X1N6_9ACTN